jgi:hypothetical protein
MIGKNSMEKRPLIKGVRWKSGGGDVQITIQLIRQLYFSVSSVT